MPNCLQLEGKNVSKLEKVNILELTQAQRLVLIRSPLEDLAKFRHGYSSCAHEAAQFLVSTPVEPSRPVSPKTVPLKPDPQA